MQSLVHACTSDAPQTVVKKQSQLHCAVAGVQRLSYRDVTFDDRTKDCSLYRHKPLFYKARPGCCGYQARWTIIADHVITKFEPLTVYIEAKYGVATSRTFDGTLDVPLFNVTLTYTVKRFYKHMSCKTTTHMTIVDKFNF